MILGPQKRSMQKSTILIVFVGYEFLVFANTSQPQKTLFFACIKHQVF